MLAAQFLNVVLEENDNRQEDAGLDSSDHESNNNTIYDIINQLDIKSQLAKILLSECTIEPSKIAEKREKPPLSFEANVTPIYETPSKKLKPNSDEYSLMNAVEAVYSDGEGDELANLPCPVCNRSFSRNCSLALHLKSHETLDEIQRRYQCQMCPRSYSQKSLFKKHQSECSSSLALQAHTKTYDTIEETHPRRFQCQFCHRSYSQKSVLKKHLVVHTGERERCNICGAGFSQRSSLVRHAKRIHGGIVNSSSSSTAAPTTAMAVVAGGQAVLQNQHPLLLSSNRNQTPILTTALSGVTHPRFGTPLIVGIPLNQLASGKFAGTPLTGGIIIRNPAAINCLPNNMPLDCTTTNINNIAKSNDASATM